MTPQSTFHFYFGKKIIFILEKIRACRQVSNVGNVLTRVTGHVFSSV